MSHQFGRDLQSSDGLAQDVVGRCRSNGGEGCSSWFSFATPSLGLGCGVTRYEVRGTGRCVIPGRR
jgi:hypothetical protein